MTINKKNLLLIVLIFVVFIVFLTQIYKKEGDFESLQTEKPDVTIDEGDNENMNTDQLKIEDIKEGTGTEAVNGKKVTVNYKGTLLDGSQFDSSYDRGVPFSFNLGAGEVIKGWDLGVLGMKVGGKRHLTIPSELGYGERGAGNDIPPNSTLIFEIELLEVE